MPATMTIITVASLEGRLTLAERRKLAETLTDAVLVPEVGQPAAAARRGFQVHFVEHAPDCLAIDGKLLVDHDPRPDVMTIDVAVMDAAWPAEVRATVIRNVLAAMATALGMGRPSSTWWVNFRIIDEGSWGSRGSVLSILDLLDTGVFTPDRVAAIRQAVR
jgi:phenylpyruvate tautomerase PptA (4-oxalocrotonate tautomerase family)